jgi:F-type H+-transporting ATPase subunit epsilon
MAEKSFLLEVVTPRRLVLSEKVDEITAPGELGEFGVLPGHIPFFATLGIGEVMYRKGNDKHYIAVSWGFAEVLGDKVTILAEIAELDSEIDVDRAKRKKEEAEKKLKDMSSDHKEYLKVKASLDKAMNRMMVAGKRM